MLSDICLDKTSTKLSLNVQECARQKQQQHLASTKGTEQLSVVDVYASVAFI